MQSRFGDVKIGVPGKPTAGLVRLFRAVLPISTRVFHRTTMAGVENLPKSGAFMIVANHSGILGLAELSCFIAQYMEKVGVDRPLAGFVHPLSFRIWPISWMQRALGSIPSTYEAGERTLADGIPILVFPGGEYESTRPIWQAYKVDFGGRTGFLKIARKANVPIVPMGFRGSHFTAPVLWRSSFVLPTLFVLPRLLKLKRMPLTLLGLIGAALIVALLPSLGVWRFGLAVLFIASPIALLPWVPWSIRIRIGPAIAPSELFREEKSDDALPAALSKIEAAVQRLVSE